MEPLRSAREYLRRAAEVRALAKLYAADVSATLNEIGDNYALLAASVERMERAKRSAT